MRKIILATALTCLSISSIAATHYPPEKREQLPSGLNNSYFGMGAGYTSFPYNNSSLTNGFRANRFNTPTFGLNVYLGHYFNPYLAAQVSLMRPMKWAYAYGIANPNDKHSIWISLFGISLKPTLPISKHSSLYALAGVGIVSRHGFDINNTTAIASRDMATFLTGGGFTYALTQHWHWNTGIEYALARPAEHQPAITYFYTGFYYLLTQRHLPEYYTTHYIFHKNLIQYGAYNTTDFDPGVNKYFTVGYLPIFWTGDVTAKNGDIFMYQRNVFHTHKRFSLDLGASISSYHSKVNNTAFQTFSVFPEIKFWFMRSQLADFYFLYSLAGPTYITKRTIDNIDTGGHFTFQDLMGVGMMIGKNKHLNMEFRIGHYSNGNLLPTNPGIQVPYTFSIGYAF